MSIRHIDLRKSVILEAGRHGSSHWSLKQVKAIPLQAWTGPEGSRRLRLPDFKTIGT